MKKLPIGVQSFEIMRSDAYYYVDKTPIIKQMVDQGRYYFLSRPRRFGKSLFLDTLKQAFTGKKEYFSGLFLEHHWDWDVCYPVINLSFGTGVIKRTADLETIIISLMDEVAQNYGIRIDGELLSLRFRELIIKLYNQHQQRVVILIDEYDKPILDNIENPDLAREIRECLKNFYSVIKDCDQYLKFVFLTGISKFSKVSLFSVLNNLQDITLDTRYATICGYTQDELISVFADQLENVDIHKVKRWYNGYHFLGENVYNPFDILLFLDNREFRNYWFETGTPTFLIKLLLKRQYPIPKIERIVATDQLLGSFDVQQIEVETLLFQTGYLTIGSVRKVFDSSVYILVYPNYEVKRSLTDFILGYLTHNTQAREENKLSLLDILMTPDLDRLRDLFHSFFASIPHDWYRKNQIAKYEGYYASVFYCYFTALGLDVTAEDTTNHGRIDLTVKLERRVFILEFKVVDQDTGKNSALKQIKEKAYHEKYRAEADELYLIGVEFNRKDRNIVRFEYEKMER